MRCSVVEQRIGQRIRTRRNLLGIAAVDLAAAAGISISQLYSHEVAKAV